MSTPSGWTLDDAIQRGRGTERPFRCHEHEDSNASASVNVLKGVWYCYACHANGTVDDTKAPSSADLLSMIDPEQACRSYPESYLGLFQVDDGYWHTRFPGWLVWQQQLGNDPFTGAATFPVRTPGGLLAGVGRRSRDPEEQPRYRYPRRWSASRTLYGLPDTARGGMIVLTEGAADACALREVGIRAYACYGAGLHAPQVELVRQLNPTLVLTGFDMDNAGDVATRLTIEALQDLVVAKVEWPQKDPAECTPGQREHVVFEIAQAVRGRGYAADALQEAHGRVQTSINDFQREQAA